MKQFEVKESDRLKKQIVELSKKYIKSLAHEKYITEKEVDENHRTALLLQNMLLRIEQLESQLHNVIINSTTKFAQMVTDIKALNHTIMTSLNNSTIKYKMECFVPADTAYPHCSKKVEWMKKNWKKDNKFKRNGVNGTICSFLHYLSNIEDHCPKTYKIQYKRIGVSTSYHEEHHDGVQPTDIIPKSSAGDEKCLQNTNDPAFPSCKAKIDWMRHFWRSDNIYASHGVDGSVCSIVQYLSEVEGWCPLLKGRKPLSKDCPIPKAAGYQHCGDKVAWMKKFWKSDSCYSNFGVNGTVCSMLVYLSEVERWCPLFPGHRYWDIRNGNITNKIFITPSLTQTRLQHLLTILQVGKERTKYDWMSGRITRLWPDWLQALDNLKKKVDLASYSKKKILIYIGLLADEENFKFGQQASKGGPLGELVQWSDVITSLFLLGHDITIVMNKLPNAKYGIKNMLKKSVSGLCPSGKKSQFDIIYTDYIGLAHMIRIFKNVNNIKCHLRIVDSFGTEAQFNTKIDASKNLYGYHGLNLKQYNTMFPHSPDNTFLGFVVENHVKPNEKIEKKKRIALVYGKHINMWQDHKKTAVLDIVQKYFEVHATVGGDIDTKFKIKYALPSYVHNHGVLKGNELQNLLKETTLFVGLGFPYEGPAPLEAIANGCFFLNAKLVPPLGRKNSQFFKQKPTERRLTSQHPYAERFIGSPYVYTVDINDPKAVEEALKDMDDKVSEPYLPYEFTFQGMMERLYMFTKHHDFCSSRLGDQSNVTWPPMSARMVFKGEKDEACDEVCSKHDLVCEPAFFPSLNDVSLLGHCDSSLGSASIIAPAVKVDTKNPGRKECISQTNALLYSCTAKSPSAERLCPCRSYVRGQTALCKGCLDGVK